MKEIVLGGGCFWGVQEFMSRLNGVKKTEVGYANGRGENPTYEDICNNNTYYAEVCKILYDENEISLEIILEEFWSIIDPTILNRQGNDIGSQYRTGIYYTDKNDIEIIEKSKNKEQQKYSKKIVTEVKPLEKYYKAEEYHQDYLKKNPGGYCHIKLD
ncbi:MAG: peptide-methionine (S)-S-oxide reductase MsrA [Clostridium baratii]|uniref:peptide-methionine (S)-S-oxide reductase MsrA n=1 Tax=Clostridium baratii TaxID=1561 RepID=UPI0006C2865D|nr:peptide-methionine (S)-S-oxide reductase MsrA [Clostridium baratii]MBS6008060.1 peptide-methionine (S)-S-oxide reductase MsrA [Clostridium baratii]MDU1055023.1 peptide-methionine (S)-S-oxide reductase MsrA [Clostridium baratii]MDU4912244.1 peptide-methionine (S)-S-oxide reductase MsrA [Clostridium baratii]CUP77955.1 methionine sulfoxide reductase A [Clostridium baratii]